MTAATAMLTMLLWIESASTPASLSLRTTDAIQSDAATSTALKWSPAMMPVTYDAKTMAAFVVKTSPLTADESVVVSVRGPAELIGFGTGDPTSHLSGTPTAPKSARAALWNGLGCVLLRATGGVGEVNVTATGAGGAHAVARLAAA